MDDLDKLQTRIESLKRQLLEAILGELQETIRLREATRGPIPTRLIMIGDSEILGPPAQPTKRVRR